MGDRNRGNKKLVQYRQGAGGGDDVGAKGSSGGGKQGANPYFDGLSIEEQEDIANKHIEMDEKFNFYRLKNTPQNTPETGWLINMHTTTIFTEGSNKRAFSALDMYFLRENGSHFKATMKYEPYFYIAVTEGMEGVFDQWVKNKFKSEVSAVSVIEKEDLDLKNHLIGLKRTLVKIEFPNTNDLMRVRKVLMPAIKRNQDEAKTKAIYEVYKPENTNTSNKMNNDEVLEHVLDIREYDVPYHIRTAIDNSITCGLWYDVQVRGLSTTLTHREDLEERPDPVIMAFDIECTKQDLKFPDADNGDMVMMISYMLDNQGYLIINRDVVSADIEDFEYTPKPDYEGPFIVWNEPDERALLQRFFDHIIEVQPTILVTFNGDFFDWPFIDKRAAYYGMNMTEQIGFGKDNADEYKSRHAIHMDAFRWVKRDSYLPQGSQGLKAVTKAKLGYDPLELDPELMCKMAREDPQLMANYSVSDAVATYYLYMKYVHPFVFSLCTIIPMEPDEVLRKGSGTLCETLLMVESYNGNIVFPNKQTTPLTRFYEGKLLESETYVGGHVEALEAGVFRSDIPMDFKTQPSAYKELATEVQEAFAYTLRAEMGCDPDAYTNMDELVEECTEQLRQLELKPTRTENPMIYHLDVSAMYPNIILTNRLQPSALVDEATCAVCDFNGPGADCQRTMEWIWRGEYIPASKQDYNQIKQQCENETHPPPSYNKDGPRRRFHELNAVDQANTIKKRLQDYSKAAYKKIKVTTQQTKESTICMRENSFYIDTVRAFRDRRYVYKGKNKEWGGKLKEALSEGDPIAITKAKNMCVLYDSLQLAHKCILNSFYGYVMRRGARWFSMEMAGIVCYTGSNIITRAREIVDRIGIPLELDTDGIWCVLPSSFPEDFVFQPKDTSKKKVTVSYPGAMLNLLVHKHFTNHQYQDLVDKDKLTYSTKSENSIFFEVDGPYRAMILPSSTEEDKLLKKRYAVFNHDGSLAELKGFELKRRGELQIIKSFQEQLFAKFLEGDDLQSCYATVAAVADHWLDVLYSKGCDLQDEELFDLISEKKSLSRPIEDYGTQKSVPVTAAKRMGDFLGPEVLKGNSLSCQLIISEKPIGAPVTERAVPILIFKADKHVRRTFLRKWLKDSSLIDCDPRTVIDWNYYVTRFGSVIQKIITIPAAFQQVSNPVPRVKHPDWLSKRVRERLDTFKQKKMNNFFSVMTAEDKALQEKARAKEMESKITDMEDFGNTSGRITMPHKTGLVTKIDRKRPADHAQSVSNEEYLKHYSEVFGDAPDKKEDYQAWVDFMKVRWAWQREQRKRRRLGMLDGAEASAVSKKSGGDPFRATRVRSLKNAHWHVLQLEQIAEQPGVFKMWVIVHGQMRSFTLTVPRVFYVNTRTEDNFEKWPRVNLKLPRGSPCLYLYEFRQSEARYQRMFHDVKMLAELMSHPDVEGVYETKVPLDYRALVQLGCIVQLAADSKHSNTDIDFELKDLDVKRDRNIVQRSYLPRNSFDYIYLYHSAGQAANDRRAIYGLFFSATKKATILVVDTVINNQLGNVRRLYETNRSDRENWLRQWAAAQTDIMGDPIRFEHLVPQEYKFEVHHVLPERQLYTALQKAVTDHVLEVRENGDQRPTLLVAQTATPVTKLAQSVPAFNDYPCLNINHNHLHNNYPALQWQEAAVKQMFITSVFKEEWLDTQIEHARYGQVPVGNLPPDVTTFVADIEFSRQLSNRGFVQWVSPSERPDLGGREEDDNTIISELQSSAAFCINNEGMYHSICVELKIESLAINAVLRAADLSLAEGVTDDGGFSSSTNQNIRDLLSSRVGTKSSLIDESAAAGPAFAALTELLNSWFTQVHQYQDNIADQLLMRFYRWLSRKEALTYDPALHHMVQSLIKKVFLQLLAQFRTLGAVVVHASFDKIIVSTNKTTPVDALAYITFVLNSIRHQDAFNIMSLAPVAMYEQLIWKDPANYGCIEVGKHLLQPPEEEVPNIPEESQVMDRNSGTKTGTSAGQDRGEGPEESTRKSTQTQGVNDTFDLNNMSMDLGVDTQELSSLPTQAQGSSLDLSQNAQRMPDDTLLFSDTELDMDMDSAQPIQSDTTAHGNIYGKESGNDIDGNHGNGAATDDMDEDDDIYNDINNNNNRTDNGIRNNKRRRGKCQINDSDVSSANEDETDTEPLEEGTQHVNERRKEDQIIMKWNMSQYLPQEVQTSFNMLVGQYIVKLYRFREQKRQAQEEEGTEPTPFNIAFNRNSGGKDDPEVQLSKQLILDTQESLFEVLPRIQKDTRMQFPNLPGSHLDMKSPALSLVNFLMNVLKLDARVTTQVSKCRKNLLRLLHVGEFSKAAQFEDPCLTFVLPEVICNFCMECRDIDLCRDVHKEEGEDGEQIGFWRCPACTTEYDKDAIEYALIDVVRKQQITFNLQDLVCDKCNGIQRLLTPSCPCSGVYRNRTSREDVMTTVKTLDSIAQFYQLRLLQDVLQDAKDGAVPMDISGAA